jgi:hypothetical protein
MVSTDEGMQMDWSAQQFSNAEPPRIETFDPALKLKFESFQQFLKQDLPIAATEEGMQIDSSCEHASNADSPNSRGFAPILNVTL